MNRDGARARDFQVIQTATVALVATALLAACDTSVGAQKSGGGAVEAVRVATIDPEGRPSSDDVEVFAAALQSGSSGAWETEVVWRAHTTDPAVHVELDTGVDFVESVAEGLRSGRFEVALLPDSILTASGSDTMRAIKAPFLVRHDAVVERIVLGSVGERLLEDLEGTGVVGLAVLPETLRHPVTYDAPLTGPETYAGRTFRALDPAAPPLFEALGARVRDANEGRVNVDFDAADSAFGQYASLAAGAVFVGDVTLWPKLNVLVAAEDWYTSLTDAQREQVLAAAKEAQAHSLETTPTDPEYGADYCAMNGTIVLAGLDAVRGLEEATAPLRAEVAEDPRTSDVYAELEAMTQAAGDPPPVAPCAPDIDQGELVRAEGEFPEGTFRAERTVEQFTDAGVDAGHARDHAGVWTLVFEDGKFLDPGCPGSTYVVQDGRVSVRLGPRGPTCGSAAGKDLFDAAWTYDGQFLQLVDVRGGADGPEWQEFHEILWGSTPWVQID
ncbi:ABC transporter substrate-binding protein [Isoptericola variabilis]|uniref:Extracellular solute-binding protein, family 7 n=1 Tax=Isoptericola variabilis (strain 225) TaxID=743718 RepID=F6FRC0_ISOV2|nr:ABC transporter substrate-binding protein [Isoptericola variabilis]AEG43881.1 Extracellular solute-binding protein, family 7 [Isoptericola variabilis 225]TWH30471.1 TRAP-type C4-dicarboxylate transport system substrate-binding protein [Isoptericola variabilis J7]